MKKHKSACILENQRFDIRKNFLQCDLMKIFMLCKHFFEHMIFMKKLNCVRIRNIMNRRIVFSSEDKQKFNVRLLCHLFYFLLIEQLNQRKVLSHKQML